MGKQPGFYFYPNDWICDVQVHSLEIQGAWMRLLCQIWWQEAKEITLNNIGFGRLLSVPENEAKRIINDIINVGLASARQNNDGTTTLWCRRWKKEEKQRLMARERDKKYRERRKHNDASEAPSSEDIPIPSPIPIPKERKTLAHFEQFWNGYPKKKNKGQAEKVWSKLKPDQDLLETILKKIEQAKRSKEWLKDNGQYIPYPATWLNAKGWEDETMEEKSSCQYI